MKNYFIIIILILTYFINIKGVYEFTTALIWIYDSILLIGLFIIWYLVYCDFKLKNKLSKIYLFNVIVPMIVQTSLIVVILENGYLAAYNFIVFLLYFLTAKGLNDVNSNNS